MKIQPRRFAASVAMITAISVGLVGCDNNQVLPETPSRPKPAKLDKNVFVPSNPGAAPSKTSGQ